jgi:hypothetical protein
MERDLKEEAKRLIDSLPSLSSWEQLMYEIYVCEAIENGLADSSKAERQALKKFARSLGCQNEGELDRRGTGSVARHPSFHRTVLAAIRNIGSRSTYEAISPNR